MRQHTAFVARSRPEVEACYRAALAADNGAPGLRDHYRPNYYAAFVRDPDGNNIKAIYPGLMMGAGFLCIGEDLLRARRLWYENLAFCKGTLLSIVAAPDTG